MSNNNTSFDDGHVTDEELPSSSSYTDLHLCDEDLDSIPERYLAPCPGIYAPGAVTRLDLSRNNFITVAGLPIFNNLVSLDVSNNSLAQLPNDIASLTQLRSVVARNNLLEDLPKCITRLTNLETLNLSGNRFIEFPYILLDCPQLKILYMGANAIETLPYAIGNMQGLSVLYLGGNRLRDVPATIGRMKGLVTLALSDNELETIPGTIAELQSLECLALHNNKIRTLPTEIVKLRNLQQLSLRNNPLVHNFIVNMTFDPPALKELAGRVVRRRYDTDNLVPLLPNDLNGYLMSANQCVNPKCKGVYFESCIEHVKFVDFCGKYRVPLLQFLCSTKCTRRSMRSESSWTSESESEDDLLPSTTSNASSSSLAGDLSTSSGVSASSDSLPSTSSNLIKRVLLG